MSCGNGLDFQSVFYGKTVKGLLEELLIDKTKQGGVIKNIQGLVLVIGGFPFDRVG